MVAFHGSLGVFRWFGMGRSILLVPLLMARIIVNGKDPRSSEASTDFTTGA